MHQLLTRSLLWFLTNFFLLGDLLVFGTTPELQEISISFSLTFLNNTHTPYPTPLASTTSSSVHRLSYTTFVLSQVRLISRVSCSKINVLNAWSQVLIPKEVPCSSSLGLKFQVPGPGFELSDVRIPHSTFDIPHSTFHVSRVPSSRYFITFPRKRMRWKSSAVDRSLNCRFFTHLGDYYSHKSSRKLIVARCQCYSSGFEINGCPGQPKMCWGNQITWLPKGQPVVYV